jgi:hypothetical protein
MLEVLKDLIYHTGLRIAKLGTIVVQAGNR